MSNGKKWTSEEDERLLELKAKGLKLRMIAKRLNRTGASADSRLRALRRNGKRAVSDGRDRAEGEISASRPATWCWTPEEERKLDELLNAGKKAAEIAVTLNRSRPAVYARLQRLYRKRARLPVLSNLG